MKTEITTDYIESLVDQLELIKSDLRYQLSFEEIDWDYVKGDTEKCANLQDHIQKLKNSLARGPRG